MDACHCQKGSKITAVRSPAHILGSSSFNLSIDFGKSESVAVCRVKVKILFLPPFCLISGIRNGSR